MNDIELDEMLNQWKAPEPGSELRARIGGMQPRKRRFTWPRWESSKGLIFGIAAGAAMFLFVVAVAAPQSLLYGSVPFTVDFEYLDYKPDGSASITEYKTEALRDGLQVVLWTTFPNELLTTIHEQFFYSLQGLLWPLIHEVHGSKKSVTADVIANDCVKPGAKNLTVLRHEKILGYDAAVILTGRPDDGIYKEWRAPALQCFNLGSTFQRRLPDGSFRLSWEKRATRITVNHPQ